MRLQRECLGLRSIKVRLVLLHFFHHFSATIAVVGNNHIHAIKWSARNHALQVDIFNSQHYFFAFNRSDCCCCFKWQGVGRNKAGKTFGSDSEG